MKICGGVVRPRGLPVSSRVGRIGRASALGATMSVFLLACGNGGSNGTAPGGGTSGLLECAVTVPDAGALVKDGGFWWNDPGGDVLNLDWHCGVDSFQMICSCNEFLQRPAPQCGCFKNGKATTTFAWTCDRNASPAALPARCGFPTP